RRRDGRACGRRGRDARHRRRRRPAGAARTPGRGAGCRRPRPLPRRAVARARARALPRRRRIAAVVELGELSAHGRGGPRGRDAGPRHARRRSGGGRARRRERAPRRRRRSRCARCEHSPFLRRRRAPRAVARRRRGLRTRLRSRNGLRPPRACARGGRAQVTRPKVLFVGRTRYRLPLEPQVARKWDALAGEMDVRVLGGGGPADDGRFRLVAGGSPAFYLALPVHVARELRTFRPDAVVAQSPYEAAAVLAGRLLARSPARVVLEVHGDWETATRLYGSSLRRLLEPVSRMLARAAVRRADAVRTVSPFTSSLVRALGVDPAATFTTYYDVSAFAPSPLPAEPRALFVGVLERYKNVHGLAEAWRIAAPRVPGATLHIVGRGRERDVVERLVHDFPGRVTWDEQLPSEGVAAALDAATVLVLPSISEGLPR